ncbi:MAG: hypothetical protein HYV63_04120 [Candidatus Schekmanbacteria bacterium]|nr:hypothetical protein [Candidatus Schekmanbacteria bacterium]
MNSSTSSPSAPRILLALAIAAAAVFLSVSTPAAAGENILGVRVTRTDGSVIKGDFLGMTTHELTIRANGRETPLSFDNVQIVDFGGEASGLDMEAASAQASPHLVIKRTGTVIAGIVKMADLRIVRVRTAEGGSKDVELDQIARIYLQAGAAPEPAAPVGPSPHQLAALQDAARNFADAMEQAGGGAALPKWDAIKREARAFARLTADYAHKIRGNASIDDLRFDFVPVRRSFDKLSELYNSAPALDHMEAVAPFWKALGATYEEVRAALE